MPGLDQLVEQVGGMAADAFLESVAGDEATDTHGVQDQGLVDLDRDVEGIVIGRQIDGRAVGLAARLVRRCGVVAELDVVDVYSAARQEG
ncbi:MAG: hypothetical protein R2710_06045 [Acidimicrobiales bacterium]